MSSTLVVTDLDGTVWGNGKRAAPATLAAIRAVLAMADVELLVATGRRRNSARRGLADNGLLLPCVLLNGAIGWDFRTETGFHQASFSSDVLAAALRSLAAAGVVPIAYLADTRAIAMAGVTTSPRHLESVEADLEWMTAAELAVRDDVLGLSALGVDAELAAAGAEALGHRDDLTCVAMTDELYRPASLMVAPAGVDKATGVDAWLEHSEMRPDRIIALGDAGNDLPILNRADIALVVDGAAEDVLKHADHVIDHPDRGGWAAVLDLL